jgi:hypothetical protein
MSHEPVGTLLREKPLEDVRKDGRYDNIGGEVVG